MSKPRIGIVIFTSRDGRFADKPAAWVRSLAAARGDMGVELLDLCEYPMPFFSERASPAWATPKNETALRCARNRKPAAYVATAASALHAR